MSTTHRFSSSVTFRTLLLLLVLTGLALSLAGCSDDNTGGDITQIPFPDPDQINWIMSIWGSGPDDVYMVGNPGFILHWDGTDWTRTDLTDETLTTVWGDGEGEVYICGHAGLIYRKSGSNWTRQDSGTEENLYDIGRGPNGDLYAVGYNGALRRQSGSAWVSTQRRAYRNYPEEFTPPDTGAPRDTLNFWDSVETFTVVSPYAIAGNGAIVLMENDTPDFNHEWLWGQVEDQSFSLFTAGTGDAVVENNFLATATGKILQLSMTLDGLQYVQPRTSGGSPLYPSTYPATLTDLWLDTEAGKLYMTSVFGQIARMNRDGNARETLFANSGYFSAIWGTGSTNIYAAGYRGVVVHWDGAAWSDVEVPLPDNSAAKSRPAYDKFGRPLS